MSPAPARRPRSGSSIGRGRARSPASVRLSALLLLSSLGSACIRAEAPGSMPASAPGSAPVPGSTPASAPVSGPGVGPGSAPSADPATEGPPTRGDAVRGRWLDTAPELAGLSGLTQRGEGRLYAVPERDPRLVPVRAHADGLAADGPAEPIRGVPEGMDLESVSRLPDGRLLFGTERLEPMRDDDLLLIARRDGEGWTISEQVVVRYADWGLSGEPNRGLEGVCAVGRRWLAVSETLDVRDGRRLAPLAWVDTASAGPPRVTPLWIALSSAEGKLSALDCRPLPGDTGEGIELFAIERHYATMRLLALRLERRPDAGTVLVPRVVRDLAETLPSAPNLEGLAIDGDDLLIVADNQGRTVTGRIATLRVLGAARAAVP